MSVRYDKAVCVCVLSLHNPFVAHTIYSLCLSSELLKRSSTRMCWCNVFNQLPNVAEWPKKSCCRPISDPQTWWRLIRIRQLNVCIGNVVRVFVTDWSEDEADSSDANSVDEVNRPARAAADGMSSGTESECLLWWTTDQLHSHDTAGPALVSDHRPLLLTITTACSAQQPLADAPQTSDEIFGLQKKDFSRPTNWPTSDVVITQQGISASGVLRPEQRQPLALPPGQLCSLRTHHVPNLWPWTRQWQHLLCRFSTVISAVLVCTRKISAWTRSAWVCRVPLDT